MPRNGPDNPIWGAAKDAMTLRNGVVLAGVVFLGANACQQPSRVPEEAILVPTATVLPTPTREVPTATAFPSPTATEVPLPQSYLTITREPELAYWRKELQSDAQVTILDFLGETIEGTVLPEDGLLVREIPDTFASRILEGYQANTRVRLKGVVDVKIPGHPDKRWALLDQGEDTPPAFAALQIDKELFILVDKEPKQIASFAWKK